MSSIPSRQQVTRADGVDTNAPWLIVLLGYAAMYVPTYWAAANGIWQTDEQAHGPIVLAVVLWLFWGLRRPFVEAPVRPAPALGWMLFAVGCLFYLAGRMFTMASAEFASQVLMVPALILLLRGKPALKVVWFPVFYLIFLVPLPGVFVDAVTAPLKNWITSIVVEMLYQAGYPIARMGVTITVGQYQMLVADACSGLHSMFSLAALGTLYMYIVRRSSRLHNALMLLAIAPIAFTANIVRVTLLILITYHFGDAAGQGFLHGAAGIALMIAALLFFFLLDSLLSLLPKSRLPGGAA